MTIEKQMDEQTLARLIRMGEPPSSVEYLANHPELVPAVEGRGYQPCELSGDGS